MLGRLAVFSTLLCSAAFAFAAPSQPVKVAVGDSIVNGTSLQPYKNLWQLSIIGQGGKTYPDVGTWSDQLEFVRADGRDCLQRTQIARFKKDGQLLATTTTINIFDPRTMAPISRSFTKHPEKGGDEITQVVFRDAAVHMEQTKDGKVESKDVTLETRPFDFYGGLYGLLLAAFPLKNGFSASLPSVNEDDPALSWVTFTVTRQELVDAGPKGRMNAWVVESDTNLGPMKFWLSKDAPYILRLEYKAKDGGMTWIYRMI